VRQPGNDDAVEVVEDGGEGLGMVGRPGGELRLDRAGLDRRHHGVLLDLLAVVGNPVHYRVAEAAELVGRHGEIIDGKHVRCPVSSLRCPSGLPGQVCDVRAFQLR
jgi:hypothetical protein